MKILAVGDLHGIMPAAVRLVEAHRPNLLLSPGDWGDPGEVPENLWRDLLERVPVHTVYGNHDDIDLLRRLRNTDGSPILLENGLVTEGCGLRLTGLSGIWAKSHRLPWYITDEDVEAIVADIAGPVDVLLTHGCPQGVADLTPANRHGGQRCFLRAFQALRPRLHVCGHLHRRQHHRTRDGAFLINPGDGRRDQHFTLEWEDREAGFTLRDTEPV